MIGGFAGALCTFLFNLLLGKLQRRRPNVEWLKFPPVFLKGEGLTAVNWVIENDGSVAAQNVVAAFSLPGKAAFRSFNVTPSEEALVYSVEEVGQAKRVIKVPNFNNGVHFSVAAIIEGLCEDETDLSIVATDVVGSERKGMTEERFRTLSARLTKVYICCYAATLMILMAAVIMVSYVINEKGKYEIVSSVADLQLRAGDTEGALRSYSDFQSKAVLFKDSCATKYKMAAIHAKRGETDKAVTLLLEVIADRRELRTTIKCDPAFSTVRSDPALARALR